MKNEELYIRYLDNELTTKENKYVEKLIEQDSEARQVFEKVKHDRKNLVKALDLLNPQNETITPPFSLHPDKTKGNLPMVLGQKFWKYAALIIILLASAIYLLFITNNNAGKSQVVSSNTTKTEYLADNMDYYISPNRCWNQRCWVVTITNLK